VKRAYQYHTTVVGIRCMFLSAQHHNQVLLSILIWNHVMWNINNWLTENARSFMLHIKWQQLTYRGFASPSTSKLVMGQIKHKNNKKINCTSLPTLQSRDGPKFGRRRSSAEGFGRMFGRRIRPNVRLGNMRLFGRTSANIRRHCGFELMAFCARRWR